MTFSKIFSVLLLLISTYTFAQSYDDLPLSQKIQIKEGNSPFPVGKKGGTNPTVQTTGPEQQCNSAIPVCQNIYTTSTSYSGNGTSQEIPNNSCLASNEVNSVWYTFTSSSAGNIAFNITPNVVGQDYDFALYNITNTNCSAISSGALTPIRCNYSANGGVTGLSPAGTSASENASGQNQSSVLPTTAGQTYVLIISNYSSSANGYQLNFTPGTASVFDVTPPTVANALAPCGSNVLTVNMTEQITCASIAANGSNFTVSGTGGPYTVTGSTGVNCGASTAQIQFGVTPALTGAGPWSLGAQGLMDNCGNAMAPATVSFSISPAIPIITGPSTICKGSVFALSVSSASSYTWSGPAIPAGQQNQQTISATANTAGTLNFTVAVNYGACGTATVSKAVTVTDAPIANFAALPSLTVCAGTLVTFTNTSTYPCSFGGLGLNQCNCSSFGCQPTSNQGTFATYLWTFGDGGTAFYTLGNPASAFSPTHTYTTPGTYVVSLNASGSINTCSNIKNMNITVLASSASLTVSPTTTICAGQSSTLSASGGTSYTWTPAATLNVSNSGTVIATPVVTTIYTVTSPGCSGTQSATVQVVVGGTPPAIGSISGPAFICANATGITYSVASVASTNYTWTVPAGATITAGINANVMTVNFGASAGTVSITALGACGSATAALNVTLSASLNLTVTPVTSSVCPNTPVVLTASGATSYTWSPSTTLSSPTGATVIATPLSTTTYTVFGSSGTCTGSTTVNISLLANLTLTLSSNASTVCAGSSALLSAVGATSYTWIPSSTLSSSSGSNVTATPLANTMYTVIGSVGTCTGVATVSVGIGACLPPSCDLALIRSTLTAAGNIELLGMDNTCSLYFINPQFMSGPAAQAYAQTFGANLISVQSAAENTSLMNALVSQGYSSNVVWIGYSDALVEGSFVWYDGSPLSYSNWAPGEPNNQGDEDCTQIFPNGLWNDLPCTGMSSLSVIEVNLCPVITLTVPPAHCALTNVTLNASTLLGSPNYTYTWVQSGTTPFTTTSTGGSTNNGISLNSAVPNTFTVYVQDRYSCPKSTAVSLNVLPTPTITATSATICLGQETATLTASGASTYSWIPSTGLNTTSAAVVTGTPSATQNYTVIGMDSNGCISGTTTSIVVKPTPTMAVSPNVTVCASNSAVLSASGPSSYTWSPAASLSSVSGATVTASPSISTIYTVQSAGANGCIATNTISVHVSNSSVVPNIYIIQKNALCNTTKLDWLNVTSVTPGLAQGTLPNGVTFTATHSNSGLSTTPSMFFGTTFPPMYSVPIPVTTIRNDSAGIFNACFSQPVLNPQIAFSSIGQAVLPITITTSTPYQVLWPGMSMTYVNPTTMIGAEGYTIIRFPGSHTCITFTYSANEQYINLAFGVMDGACQGQPICPGTPIELVANGASSYTWSTGANSTTITPAPLVTTTYSVSGISSSGCINTAVTTVTVNPTPTITVNSSSICLGQQTATLTASGAATYSWIPGTGLNTTSGSVVNGTPSSSQNYTVIGMDSNGCLNGATTSITVNSLPTIAASSASICLAQQIATLTANGAISYSWSPATNLSAATGSVVTGTPPITENYTILGIDANGCTNTATSAITVNSLPIITATSSSICLGQQTATLTANGATTYSWIPGTNLSTTTGSVVTGTPSITQGYTVVGLDANGCMSGTTTAITVNAIPIITANTSTICLGQQTATLTANGASTYSWIPGANLSATTGSVVTGTPAVTESYTVVGIDANGCIGGTTTTITVNPLPVILASPDLTVCPLSANTLTASGAVSYTWSPNIYLNTNTGSSVISKPLVTTSYTIDGTSSVGCTSSTAMTIAVANTVVVTSPVTSTTICPLGNVSLTGSGATTYTWSPALTLSSPTGSTVIASPPASTTYTVIGSTSTCTNSIQVAVTVTINPTISAAPSLSNICSGSSTSLTASGASSYTWSPAATLSSTIGGVVSASPNITTIYNVTGASPFGCLSSNSTTVTVVQTPTINLVANPRTICAGYTSTLSALGATNYTWSPGLSLNTVNGNTTIATPPLTTTYTVIGDVSNGAIYCSDTKTLQVLVLPNPTITPGPNMIICEGQSTLLYGTGANSYTWSPTIGVALINSGTTNVSPPLPGVVIYTLTGSVGICSGSTTMAVTVNPLPILNAGVDTTVNIDQLISLSGFGDTQVGFINASTGVPLDCNYCPTVTVNPQENTCYIMEGISALGCRTTDEVCVTVLKDWDVFIPNAFTPNGDIHNQFFVPVGYGISTIHLEIYDRWGHLIFKDEGQSVGWDGTNKGQPCEQGVYIYKAEITAMSGAKRFKTGHVTLLAKLK